MLNIKVVTLSLALFTTISYLLCVAYGLIVPRELHMSPLLEMVLPGFKWLSPGSFFLGLVESFLWGVYVGIVFVPIHNLLSRRSAKSA